MRLTIDSENLIKKDISQVILNKDIHLTKNTILQISRKVILILTKGEKIIDLQKYNLDDEDSQSQKHIQYSKIFIYITFIQIVIAIIIGVYNLYSFKNFLELRNLI